jgi:hypothetical protein
LSTKEKTQTRFPVNLNNDDDVVITAKVISTPNWWPVPIESYAQTLVLKELKKAADKKKK